MTKETPGKSVKGSPFKGNGNRGYYSDKNTQPLNDVLRFDEKTKEYYIAKGLTEEQKIAEGYMPPLQHQLSKITRPDGSVIRRVGRFERDSFDKKQLKLLHTGRKGPSGWMSSDANQNQRKSTLIVHLKNPHSKKDYQDRAKLPEGTPLKHFKTTYAFPEVKQNEIFQVLSTIIRLNRDVKNDNYLNYVVKYHFDGKTYKGNA